MSFPAITLTFDKRGTQPFPRTTSGASSGCENSIDVIPINFLANDPVGGSTLCHAATGSCLYEGGAQRPLVVFADEDHRKSLDGSKIKRLVERALIARAFPEETENHG